MSANPFSTSTQSRVRKVRKINHSLLTANESGAKFWDQQFYSNFRQFFKEPKKKKEESPSNMEKFTEHTFNTSMNMIETKYKMSSNDKNFDLG